MAEKSAITFTMRRVFKYKNLNAEIEGWFPYSVLCYSRAPRESAHVADTEAFKWLREHMGQSATSCRFSRPRNRAMSQDAYVFLNEEARWDVLGPVYFFRDRTDATAFRLFHG